MKNAVEITTKIMELGFNRVESGILAKAVYNSIKWEDTTFITLACKMFKDKRTNQWGNESGLIDELINKFNIKY